MFYRFDLDKDALSAPLAEGAQLAERERAALPAGRRLRGKQAAQARSSETQLALDGGTRTP
eukprot:8057775-Pyramimonas_sp.AAC.1